MLGSVAALSFLLSAYALTGVGMSSAFYVGSGQHGFEIAAKLWGVVMVVSLLLGIAFTIAAWRKGR